MKLLTYKVIPNITDWLRVIQSIYIYIYIHALKPHEWLAETQLNTHTEPARTFWARLRIR